jgi:oligopeptide transport system substrate-binding protein
MILHDWKPDLPDAYNYYSIYSSDSRLTAQWSNAEYDALLDRARAAGKPAERKALYTQADLLLTRAHTAMIPVYYHAEAVLVGRRIKDFQNDAFNLHALAGLNLK